MKDFWYWYKVPVILIAVGLIVLVSLVYGLDKSIKAEQAKWNAFAIAHNCEVVGKKKGNVQTTVMPMTGGNNNGGVGIGISTTPDTTAYLCDDGITYWR